MVNKKLLIFVLMSNRYIMDGLRKIKPLIKKISFPFKGKMSVLMADGRDISVPLQYFPSIKKLNAEQRELWYVLDGEMF